MELIRDIMANQDQVKAYLACWLQMGKAIDVDLPSGQHQLLQPKTVLKLGRYSDDFEHIWRFVLRHPNNCFLSNTNESIQDLLSDRWEIGNCSRCMLLLPLPTPISLSQTPCPCSDLDHWPNWDSLKPRAEQNTAVTTTEPALNRIVQRLETARA